jgi:antitoxin (DNA-binding transcriptional repressor) of toxin-antitoxin stability system
LHGLVSHRYLPIIFAQWSRRYPFTVEAAARSLADVVDRVQVTGETALLTRSGRAAARIAAVPAERKKVDDRMAFPQPWRVAHPEPDGPFSDALEASRRAALAAA